MMHLHSDLQSTTITSASLDEENHAISRMLRCFDASQIELKI